MEDRRPTADSSSHASSGEENQPQNAPKPQPVSFTDSVFLSRSHTTNLIARIAKVGHAALPVPRAYICGPSETERGSFVRYSPRSNNFTGPTTRDEQDRPNAKPSQQHGQQESSSQSEVGRYEVGFTLQQPQAKTGINFACHQVIPYRTGPPSNLPTESRLVSYLSESKAQVSDLQSSVNKISDKVEFMLLKLDEMQVKGNQKGNSNSSGVDPLKILENIRNVMNENEDLRKNLKSNSDKKKDESRKDKDDDHGSSPPQSTPGKSQEKPSKEHEDGQKGRPPEKKSDKHLGRPSTMNLNKDKATGKHSEGGVSETSPKAREHPEKPSEASAKSKKDDKRGERPSEASLKTDRSEKRSEKASEASPKGKHSDKLSEKESETSPKGKRGERPSEASLNGKHSDKHFDKRSEKESETSPKGKRGERPSEASLKRRHSEKRGERPSEASLKSKHVERQLEKTLGETVAENEELKQELAHRKSKIEDLEDTVKTLREVLANLSKVDKSDNATARQGVRMLTEAIDEKNKIIKMLEHEHRVLSEQVKDQALSIYTAEGGMVYGGDVKRLMNSAFQKVRGQFDDNGLYTGIEVMKSVAAALRGVGLEHQKTKAQEKSDSKSGFKGPLSFFRVFSRGSQTGAQGKRESDAGSSDEDSGERRTPRDKGERRSSKGESSRKRRRNESESASEEERREPRYFEADPGRSDGKKPRRREEEHIGERHERTKRDREEYEADSETELTGNRGTGGGNESEIETELEEEAERVRRKSIGKEERKRFKGAKREDVSEKTDRRDRRSSISRKLKNAGSRIFRKKGSSEEEKEYEVDARYGSSRPSDEYNKASRGYKREELNANDLPRTEKTGLWEYEIEGLATDKSRLQRQDRRPQPGTGAKEESETAESRKGKRTDTAKQVPGDKSEEKRAGVGLESESGENLPRDGGGKKLETEHDKKAESGDKLADAEKPKAEKHKIDASEKDAGDKPRVKEKDSGSRGYAHKTPANLPAEEKIGNVVAQEPEKLHGAERKTDAKEKIREKALESPVQVPGAPGRKPQMEYRNVGGRDAQEPGKLAVTDGIDAKKGMGPVQDESRKFTDLDRVDRKPGVEYSSVGAGQRDVQEPQKLTDKVDGKKELKEGTFTVQDIQKEFPKVLDGAEKPGIEYRQSVGTRNANESGKFTAPDGVESNKGMGPTQGVEREPSKGSQGVQKEMVPTRKELPKSPVKVADGTEEKAAVAVQGVRESGKSTDAAGIETKTEVKDKIVPTQDVRDRTSKGRPGADKEIIPAVPTLAAQEPARGTQDVHKGMDSIRVAQNESPEGRAQVAYGAEKEDGVGSRVSREKAGFAIQGGRKPSGKSAAAAEVKEKSVPTEDIPKEPSKMTEGERREVIPTQNIQKESPTVVPGEAERAGVMIPGVRKESGKHADTAGVETKKEGMIRMQEVRKEAPASPAKIADGAERKPGVEVQRVQESVTPADTGAVEKKTRVEENVPMQDMQKETPKIPAKVPDGAEKAGVGPRFLQEPGKYTDMDGVERKSEVKEKLAERTDIPKGTGKFTDMDGVERKSEGRMPGSEEIPPRGALAEGGTAGSEKEARQSFPDKDEAQKLEIKETSRPRSVLKDSPKSPESLQEKKDKVDIKKAEGVVGLQDLGKEPSESPEKIPEKEAEVKEVSGRPKSALKDGSKAREHVPQKAEGEVHGVLIRLPEEERAGIGIFGGKKEGGIEKNPEVKESGRVGPEKEEAKSPEKMAEKEPEKPQVKEKTSWLRGFLKDSSKSRENLPAEKTETDAGRGAEPVKDGTEKSREAADAEREATKSSDAVADGKEGRPQRAPKEAPKSRENLAAREGKAEKKDEAGEANKEVADKPEVKEMSGWPRSFPKDSWNLPAKDTAEKKPEVEVKIDAREPAKTEETEKQPEAKERGGWFRGAPQKDAPEVAEKKPEAKGWFKSPENPPGKKQETEAAKGPEKQEEVPKTQDAAEVKDRSGWLKNVLRDASKSRDKLPDKEGAEKIDGAQKAEAKAAEETSKAPDKAPEKGGWLRGAPAKTNDKPPERDAAEKKPELKDRIGWLKSVLRDTSKSSDKVPDKDGADKKAEASKETSEPAEHKPEVQQEMSKASDAPPQKFELDGQTEVHDRVSAALGQISLSKSHSDISEIEWIDVKPELRDFFAAMHGIRPEPSPAHYRVFENLKDRAGKDKSRMQRSHLPEHSVSLYDFMSHDDDAKRQEVMDRFAVGLLSEPLGHNEEREPRDRFAPMHGIHPHGIRPPAPAPAQNPGGGAERRSAAKSDKPVVADPDDPKNATEAGGYKNAKEPEVEVRPKPQTSDSNHADNPTDSNETEKTGSGKTGDSGQTNKSSGGGGGGGSNNPDTSGHGNAPNGGGGGGGHGPSDPNDPNDPKRFQDNAKSHKSPNVADNGKDKRNNPSSNEGEDKKLEKGLSSRPEASKSRVDFALHDDKKDASKSRADFRDGEETKLALKDKFAVMHGIRPESVSRVDMRALDSSLHIPVVSKRTTPPQPRDEPPAASKSKAEVLDENYKPDVKDRLAAMHGVRSELFKSKFDLGDLEGESFIPELKKDKLAAIQSKSKQQIAAAEDAPTKSTLKKEPHHHHRPPEEEVPPQEKHHKQVHGFHWGQPANSKHPEKEAAPEAGIHKGLESLTQWHAARVEAEESASPKHQSKAWKTPSKIHLKRDKSHKGLQAGPSREAVDRGSGSRGNLKGDRSSGTISDSHKDKHKSGKKDKSGKTRPSDDKSWLDMYDLDNASLLYDSKTEMANKLLQVSSDSFVPRSVAAEDGATKARSVGELKKSTSDDDEPWTDTDSIYNKVSEDNLRSKSTVEVAGARESWSSGSSRMSVYAGEPRSPDASGGATSPTGRHHRDRSAASSKKGKKVASEASSDIDGKAPKGKSAKASAKDLPSASKASATFPGKKHYRYNWPEDDDSDYD